MSSFLEAIRRVIVATKMLWVKQTNEQISLFHCNTTAGSFQNSWLTTLHNRLLETKNEEPLETVSWSQSRVYVYDFLDILIILSINSIELLIALETVSYWIVVVAWNWQYNISLISNWQLY